MTRRAARRRGTAVLLLDVQAAHRRYGAERRNQAISRASLSGCYGVLARIEIILIKCR